LLAWLCAASFTSLGLAAEKSSDNKKADAAFWNSVYAENHVLDVQISITREAWDTMQPQRRERRPGEDGPRVDFGNQFPYAKTKVVIDGLSLPDTGMRFKGNSSYRFASRGLKRPFKIDTNRFAKGQKLHGRTKLNFSNAFLDSAFMKEKLGYELYHAAGMPTPGVGWADVTLTIEGLAKKKPLGIYVIIEQVDDRYIGQNLGKASKGSLLMKPESVDDWRYLGEEPKAYERYNIKLGEKNVDQIRRFAKLLKLVEQGSDDEFAREIGKRMNLEQFAGYLAATSILVNIDSYIGMPHNYYLLMDKADGRLRMLPWDLNETFGTFTMGRSPEMLAKWDIDRPWISKRRLSERLFETESFRKRYRTAVAKLMKEHFTEEKLFERIDTFEKAITPHIKKDEIGKGFSGMKMGINGDSNGVNKAVDRRVFAIKPFILQRITSVNDQLTGKTEGEKIQGRKKRPR
ncbi:MAG: CotH kinase family protein, partial [Verrucomicrobiota bacterium]|nr:CotH kinase family protein [Verrucomicrobiota bacterium]